MIFAVLATTGLPDHLDGYITRFMVEIATNVSVGSMSRRVADSIWERVVAAATAGSAVMVISDASLEQGYQLLTHGPRTARTIDLDGIVLPARLPHTRPVQ